MKFFKEEIRREFLAEELFDVVVGMVSVSMFECAMAKVSNDLELEMVLPYRVALAAQEAMNEIVYANMDIAMDWLTNIENGDACDIYEVILALVKPLFDKYDKMYEVCV